MSGRAAPPKKPAAARFGAALRRALPALTALVLALAFAAAFPLLFFTAKDARLAARPLARRQLTSRLAAQATDIYLVRALHAQREALAAQGGGAETPIEDEAYIRTALQTQAAAARKALALPTAVAAALEEMLAAPAARFSGYTDAAGFAVLQCSAPWGQGGWLALGAEVEPVSGQAVRLWANWLPEDAFLWEGAAPAPLLNSYLAAAGLADLPDWLPAPGDNGTTRLASAGAGLQAYVRLGYGSFLIGLVAVY